MVTSTIYAIQWFECISIVRVDGVLWNLYCQSLDAQQKVNVKDKNLTQKMSIDDI